jgi:6-phosphofructo-2-kinase/fructose-2,6-biphosphatase 4
MSNDCEQSIWNSFDEGMQIVIYDANNGTNARREGIANRFHERGIHVIMLGPDCPLIVTCFSDGIIPETMCDNNEIVEANIRSVKISSPDVRFIRRT